MKKSIKLDSAKAVEEALDAVNGKAISHTYTSCAELVELAKDAEAKLEGWGIPRKERAGAMVDATSGGRVPNAYKYARVATTVCLERRPSGWVLTKVAPDLIYKEGGGMTVRLTPAQAETARRKLFAQFAVQAPTQAV